MKDRNLKLRELAPKKYQQVVCLQFLRENLNIRNLLSKWVPLSSLFELFLFFLDVLGTLLMNHLDIGKNINNEYYMALLDRLSIDIQKKRPYMQNKIVLL